MKIKLKELKNKTKEELLKVRDDLRKEIYRLLTEKKLKKLSKPHMIKITKKNLARVLTLLRQKNA